MIPKVVGTFQVWTRAQIPLRGFGRISLTFLPFNHRKFASIERTMSAVTYPDTSLHFALPEAVKPEHYDVKIFDVDHEKHTFRGITTIDFKVFSEIESVTLNQKLLNFENTTAKFSVGKTDSEVAVSETIKIDEDETVEFKFPSKVPSGQLKLTILYDGAIRIDMGGFYDSSYKDSTGALQPLLCTQFESTDARSAFPCYDEPNIKATFDISIIVPEDLDVLGNMPVASSKTLDDGKKGPTVDSKLKIIEFETTPLMSTYLVAWCIGKFDYVEAYTDKDYNGKKLPIRVYTVPGQSQTGEYALDVAKKVVDYLSEIFDIDYPLPKLDLIAVPAFGANAMENWGLVLFRSTALLYDHEKSDIKYQKKVTYVVSHEIAHSWFGNYCTMNWWSDLWLNESFATYVGWICVDKLHPEWDTFTEFVSTVCQVALNLDSLRSSHPVEVQVYHAKEIDQIFDTISYLKGGSVVRMVAESVGVEPFLKGVSEYLKKHPFGNAKSDDLWDSVSEVTGKPITKLVEPWIRAMGFPYIYASLSSDGGSVQLTQKRFIASGDLKDDEDKAVWWIPGESMDTKTKTIPASEFSKLNKDSVGFYRVFYEPVLFKRVLSQLHELSAKDKIGLVADTLAGAQAGLVPASDFLNLVSLLKNESDPAVWIEIDARLSSLKKLFGSDSKLSAQLNNFSRDLYKTKFEQLLKIPSNEISFLDSNLRSLLLKASGTAGLEAALEFAQASIQASSLDPSLRSGVLKTLLANKATCTDENFEKAFQEVVNPSSVDAKESALEALGCISKPEAYLNKLLDLFFTEKLPEMEYIFLMTPLAANAKTQATFWEFFKSKYTEFETKTSAWTLDRVLRGFLPSFANRKLLEDVEQFFAGVDTVKYDKGLKQSIDAIRTNVAWVERDYDNVSKWLSENNF